MYEWVKVSDETPRPYKTVLVYGNMIGTYFVDIDGFSIGGVDHEGNWSCHSEDMHVTHWCELPPAPKN